MSTTEEHHLMVSDCMRRQKKLTDWEYNFIDGMAYRLREGYEITEKQDEMLTLIWEKVTENG